MAGWATKTVMNHPVTDVACAVSGGKLYAIGGYEANFLDEVNYNQEYDPSTNEWTDKATMPTARWGAAAAECGGLIYVFGGNYDGYTGSNKCEAYNPSSNSWSTKTNVPDNIAYQGIMAVTVGSKIYIFGRQYCYEFDPAGGGGSGSYTQKADHPDDYWRRWATCAYVSVGGEDRIYIIGGWCDYRNAKTNVNYYYKPSTNTWSTQKTSAPYAAWGVLRENPVYNSRIFYGYGHIGTAFVAYLYRYNPSTDSWSILYPEANYPRDGQGCGVINGYLYAVGGRDTLTNPYGVNYNEQYDILTPTVENTGVSVISSTTATLNGKVPYCGKGGNDPTVHVYWGDNDGGVVAGNWDHDENLGIKVDENFHVDLTALTPETTYYYRCYITNSDGSYWATESISFKSSSWVGTFAKRKKITIDADDIDSDLTWFPVTIFLGAAVGIGDQDLTEIFDDLGSNSKKIAVATSDGTQLYVEIELWDATNEVAVLHVSKSAFVIDDTIDTDLYIYWDPAQSDNDTYVGVVTSTPAKNVWDTNYVLVLHLTGASLSALKDSTSNANHPSASGGSPTYNAAGKIGKAVDFERDTSDYITIPDANSLDLTTLWTIEAWFKPEVVNVTHFVVEKYDWIAGRGSFCLRLASANMLGYLISGQTLDSVTGATNLVAGTWYYHVVTFNDSTNTLRILLNGVQDGINTGATKTPYTSVTSLKLGQAGDGTVTRLDGVLDEVRLSDVVRSDAWIKATYQSLIDDLLTFDVTETYLPNAPTNLAGVCVGTSRIDLTWTDNATGETAYYVERDDGGWHVIATLPPNTEEYSDGDIECSVGYLYRVRCYNGRYSNYDTLSSEVLCPCVIQRMVIDSLGLFESKSRKISKKRTQTESTGLLESKSRVLSRKTTVSESMGLLESKSRVKEIHRVVSDLLGMKESKTRTKLIHRVISDVLGMKESKSRTKLIHRVVSDLLGMKDFVSYGAPAPTTHPIGPTYLGVIYRKHEEVIRTLGIIGYEKAIIVNYDAPLSITNIAELPFTANFGAIKIMEIPVKGYAGVDKSIEKAVSGKAGVISPTDIKSVGPSIFSAHKRQKEIVNEEMKKVKHDSNKQVEKVKRILSSKEIKISQLENLVQETEKQDTEKMSSMKKSSESKDEKITALSLEIEKQTLQNIKISEQLKGLQRSYDGLINELEGLKNQKIVVSNEYKAKMEDEKKSLTVQINTLKLQKDSLARDIKRGIKRLQKLKKIQKSEI